MNVFELKELKDLKRHNNITYVWVNWSFITNYCFSGYSFIIEWNLPPKLLSSWHPTWLRGCHASLNLQNPFSIQVGNSVCGKDCLNLWGIIVYFNFWNKFDWITFYNCTTFNQDLFVMINNICVDIWYGF